VASAPGDLIHIDIKKLVNSMASAIASPAIANRAHCGHGCFDLCINGRAKWMMSFSPGNTCRVGAGYELPPWV
jgi:hypothetical protein